MKTLSPAREVVKIRSIRRQGFASRLRAWREAQGLRQIDICNTLGIHTNSWSAWENGEATPRFETAQRIADTYEIDWHWLITGKTPRGIPYARVQQAYELLAIAIHGASESPTKSPFAAELAQALATQRERNRKRQRPTATT